MEINKEGTMIILFCILVSLITTLTMMIWHLRQINRMLKNIHINCTELTLSVKKDIEK